MRILMRNQALILLVAAAATGTAAPLEWRESRFAAGVDGKPPGWSTWSARAETAPRTWIDTVNYRGEPGALAISGNSNAAAHGGWQRSVDGVTAGAWYRFSAYYRAAGVPAEIWQVVARLDWRTAQGRRAGQPDYVYAATRDGDWTRVSLDAQAPAEAASATVQLYLSNAPLGTVWWDDLALAGIPAPEPRKVTVASVNLRPRGTGAAAESVRRFIETIDRAVPAKTDVILLPEGITVIGTGKTYAEVAEPVPGPTSLRLGEVARRRGAWIAAGVYEREGQAIYNTAILVDREGKLAGRYRKVYLPREEVEGGLTPGSDYPVFRTDFGTIGMMICYDVFYADPARALAMQGAELILMPIWGGDQTLGKARAIENKVFVAASGYDYPTYIMDPEGEVLSLAGEQGRVALATIDLNKRYGHPHLGDMKARRMKELRVDVRAPSLGH